MSAQAEQPYLSLQLASKDLSWPHYTILKSLSEQSSLRGSGNETVESMLKNYFEAEEVEAQERNTTCCESQ